MMFDVLSLISFTVCINRSYRRYRERLDTQNISNIQKEEEEEEEENNKIKTKTKTKTNKQTKTKNKAFDDHIHPLNNIHLSNVFWYKNTMQIHFTY